MLQILCSSVRVKLLARAKVIFLREQPDDFFFCGEPCSIFTLGAPHEEVQGRQTKLHPPPMGKLVQPSPGISILRDAHIVLSNQS